MGRIKIKSLKYEGKKYFYFNDKFKDGKNILLGENGNGKSTFTYLIIYSLGIKVDYFINGKEGVIEEIFSDEDKYVELVININEEEYVLNRKIPSSYISVYDVKRKSYTSYNIARNGDIYEKEKKTFSDWILEKLNIGITEVSQFSTNHKINFDDLFRLMYYDQKTPSGEIIGGFGIKSTDYFKNSSIMKRSIFEILISDYFKEYYNTYYEIKDKLKEKEEIKETKKSIQSLIEGVVRETNLDKIEDIEEVISYNKGEIERLKKIRETHINSNYENSIEENNELNIDRINSIQEEISLLTMKKNKLEIDIEEIQEEINKAQYVRKNLEDDINYLDRILFTSKMYNIINDDTCPFCLEKINENAGKCICGSDKYLDYEKFIYSDVEYLKMMKSKIKGLRTTNYTIESCEEELKEILSKHKYIEEKLKYLLMSIKEISAELVSGIDFKSVDMLTEEIMLLKEELIELEVLKSKLDNLDNVNKNIANLENKLDSLRKNLDELEIQKSDIISKNLKIFFDKYYLWITEFYDDKKINISLDRDYKPVVKFYREESFSVPKRFFYYLSLLNLSLKKNINYPRFLLIDTLKSAGIDVPRLRNLIPYLNELEGEEYQVIMTCGYEEYDNSLNWNIIDELSDENKLLKLK
ncbi:hypothetical protein P3F01_01620 [Clostridium perfringens]|uniref:hypothetical protein n=1 Tax=Clostridium perfringens TaxID=1502 RepID=UPI0024BC4FB3|nr:hypothetical protein [Clostridium perfringens]MDT9335067.1 hypothetical protein [Clostridium perfringens]MDT9342827.1 hypothetical protein [Clostridium perfringens]MDT9346007.1 hypothetical protein [Clostridium perfringens]MDT9351911.1 hypothetical protein [Clostridium perfringens]